MRDDDECPTEDRDYYDFLRRKVETALAQIAAGRFLSNDLVEAHFAARRAALRRETGMK